MKKILVIQTAFPGDAILTLPLIQQLKLNNPDSVIHVVCIPSTGDIFTASNCVDKVFIFDKKGKEKGFINSIIFSLQIRKQKYSCIYSPHRSFRTSLLVLIIGAKTRIGFNNSSFKFVYNKLIKYEKDHHEVKRNLNLINPEMNNWKMYPEVNENIVNKTVIDQILENSKNKKIIFIAPGSIWATKKYPENYFKEVINSLVLHNYYIVLIGSEQDEQLCRLISSDHSENVLITAGKLNIVESINTIRIATLLISNDSAPTHMGIAANVPVLTLFCSTVPEFGFYPYNEKSSYLSFNDLDCKPCGIHGHDKCPIKTFVCGYNLKPRTVLDKIDEMIN